MSNIEREIRLAEQLLRDWPKISKEKFIHGIDRGLLIGGLAYEVEDLIACQYLGVSDRNRLFEGAVVVSLTPTPIFIDRVLLAVPLIPVGLRSSLPLLCEDWQIISDLGKSASKVPILKYHLERQMKIHKKYPEAFRNSCKTARGRGESIGAVSGGLPTLGKRR